MTSLACDILIIGSGAAGGVLAATLSEFTKKKIVVVEKGGWFGADFFNQREWDMRVLYADEGRRSTADGAMPVRGGECVGGGTTINYALCFNPNERVWRSWRESHGVSGFSFDANAKDYGVPRLNIPNALAEVRERINVHRASEEEINDNNRILADGCRALGIASQRFELNMRGCVRSGFCGEGCSYDAKLGTLITYVADAVARGVQLVHHCDVERITFAKRNGALKATGIRGRVRATRAGSKPNSVPAGRIEIDAKLVIVAAGAIATPALLQRSGHPDPHARIGRGLVLHPSLPIIGRFDRELVNYRGIPGTVYSDAFADSHHIYLESLFGHPVYGSLVIPGIGKPHFDVLRDYRRLAGFGVMLVDEVSDANRVEWNADDEKPRIHYRVSEDDKERLRFGAKRGLEIMLAAGARDARLASDEPADDLQFLPYRTVLTSAHAQATVKMSDDAERGVTNSRGESHLVRNLIVCDSSSFPTSCGANPMLSILTMARYQGRRIAAEQERYAL
ncbi:MAG TPA: GMC family oxidoreductase [Thermoanaerobaculia bacterium]|nr:GMC family oxidoreductase [Thermoanaerobaculia bacterium]